MTDTSRETVELLADAAAFDGFRGCAATLRALLAERDAARAEGKRAGLEVAAQWHEAEAESWWQRCRSFPHGTIEHQQAREQARQHDDMAEVFRTLEDGELRAPRQTVQ
jgi:hypothetical protein